MKTQGVHDNNGALLSQLLMKYYFAKEINLSTLVSFRLWPEYLHHFGKGISVIVYSITIQAVKLFMSSEANQASPTAFYRCVLSNTKSS